MQASYIRFGDILYSYNYQNKAEQNPRIESFLSEDVETYPKGKIGVNIQKDYYVMMQLKKAKSL